MRGVRGSCARILAVAAGLCAAPMLLNAHHSTRISYHMNETVELEGTVTRVRFHNPHSQLHFDVVDEDGNTVSWVAEMASPGNWRRRGWSEETFSPGTQIRVVIHPARSGAPVGHPQSITLPDGTVVDQGGRALERDSGGEEQP